MMLSFEGSSMILKEAPEHELLSHIVTYDNLLIRQS